MDKTLLDRYVKSLQEENELQNVELIDEGNGNFSIKIINIPFKEKIERALSMYFPKRVYEVAETEKGYDVTISRKAQIAYIKEMENNQEAQLLAIDELVNALRY